jgi:hypothetical protein
MFSVVIAAAMLAFAPAQPAAGAKPAPPLREIVYKFSYDSRTETPPGASTIAGSFAGTMTLDVTQVGGDGTVRVTATVTGNELKVKKPVIADIIVRPDGGLIVHNGEYDTEMMTLLPYLATNYFGDHELQEGASWKHIAKGDNVQTTTTYNVSHVTSTTATISSVSQARGSSVNGPMTLKSRLVYKASLLVPLSLDVVVVHSGNGQTNYHFNRVSDTRDRAGSGR